MITEKTAIKKNNTGRPLLLASLLLTSLLLTSCATESLKAPCPDYGRHCDKTPVNSWDTSTV